MTVALHAFDGLTGAHLTRLDRTSLRWSDSISEAGSLDAEVPLDQPRDLARCLRCYGSVLAAVEGSEVLHAGYVTKVTVDRAARSVAVSAGGGWTVLEKRLVLDRALASGWRDGQVLIDEDNPPGSWVLNLRGTYRDIARGLLAETMAWGALPFSLPPVEGGTAHERTYNSWDFATVADRLGDLADLEDGPEVRFDPRLDARWNLTFALNVADEIVDHSFRWNCSVPGQAVALGDSDCDGSAMCSQSFGVGGKDDDLVLVARATGTALTSRGWPLLQSANTGHTTISRLETLRGYVRADVAAGDSPQETVSLTVPMSTRARPGDHADVRVPADAMAPGGLLRLKVTDVSGDAATGRLTLQCRERA